MAQSRRTGLRLLLSFAVGIGTAILAAIALTVVDLYLSGHGMPPLGRPLIDLPRLGVHLSLADAILLGSVGLALPVAWRLTLRI